MYSHCNQCYQIRSASAFFFTLKFLFVWQSFPTTCRPKMFWKCLLLRAVSRKSVASFTPRSAASFTTLIAGTFSDMHHWCPIRNLRFRMGLVTVSISDKSLQNGCATLLTLAHSSQCSDSKSTVASFICRLLNGTPMMHVGNWTCNSEAVVYASTCIYTVDCVQDQSSEPMASLIRSDISAEYLHDIYPV